MSPLAGNRRKFKPLPGGGYVLDLLDDGVQIEFRHLRRNWKQLYGEINVRCQWAGASVSYGTDSIDRVDMNLSKLNDRVAQGRHCEKRMNIKPNDFDILGVIDEACRRVIDAEAETGSLLVLDDAPTVAEHDFNIHGLIIPADAGSVFIADGDTLKSLLTLFVLIHLAQQGHRVCLVDNEWTAARHLTRKRRLHGDGRLDNLLYWNSRGPIALELDPLRRHLERERVTFIAIDSISNAVEGKLTDDDSARDFQRCLAQLPPALCVAHVSKKEKDVEAGKGQTPFGSVFFRNFARMGWMMKKQAGASDDVVTVGCFPTKQNDGARVRPVGFEFSFSPQHIDVKPVDLAGVDGLSNSLPLRVRMVQVLKRGALPVELLANELDVKRNSIDQTLKRDNGKTFLKIPNVNGSLHIGLLQPGIH